MLNFTDLEYMNPGGIGLLVTLLVRANRAKQKLLAFGIGLTMGGHGKENKFWEATMENLASRLGVETPTVATTMVCVDGKRQWSRATNVRHSVAIRSTLHLLKPGKGAPPPA